MLQMRKAGLWSNLCKVLKLINWQNNQDSKSNHLVSRPLLSSTIVCLRLFKELNLQLVWNLVHLSDCPFLLILCCKLAFSSLLYILFQLRDSLKLGEEARLYINCFICPKAFSHCAWLVPFKFWSESCVQSLKCFCILCHK